MNVTDSTAVLAANPGAAPKPRSELGKDEFLQLLVTQLRNQDPMNPSNAQEFAAQLAQFTSLEQLTNVNETLTQQNEILASQIQAQAAGTAVSVIGKEVVAQSDQLLVGDTTGIDFAAPNAGRATVRLLDATGAEVRQIDLGYVGAGRTERDLTEELEGVAPGAYTVEIDITDASGNVTSAMSFTRGRVDGVRYTNEGPMLVLGSLMIPLNAVIEVTAN